MTKISKVVLSSLVLLGVVASLLTLGGRDIGTRPAQAKGDAKMDVLSSLPTQDELTEFGAENKTVKSHRNETSADAYITSLRKGDEAQFRVESLVTDTEEEAKALVQRAIITQAGPGSMPKGSSSKRQIGQECYNSNRQEGPPQGFLTIIARDGRAVATVQLAVPVIKDKNGKFVEHMLGDKEVELVEKHALKVLDKLTKLGYTSKSAK